MAVKKSAVNKSMDKAFVGNEPIVAEIHGRNDPQFTKMLNWYNYVYGIGDGKPWLLQWMKLEKFDKTTIEAVKKSPDVYIPTTICWVAKMALNGTKFSDANLDYVRSRIAEISERYNRNKLPEPIEEEFKPSNVISIQDRTKAKVEQILTMAEEEVVDSGLPMYQFLLKHSCTPAAANYMRAYYIKSRDELFSDDPQVKEAYGKSLKKWQTFWQGVIDDIDRYVGNKKAVKVKKEKTIKIKPISKVVERLNYQKEDPTLKLVSVLPQEIIGSKELWTYNTKDRKLTVFYATGPNGLGVKGSTLTDFDTEKSEAKRLRKPEATLSELLKAGRVAIRKIMPSLTTTAVKPTGRINNMTILLKAIK